MQLWTGERMLEMGAVSRRQRLRRGGSDGCSCRTVPSLGSAYGVPSLLALLLLAWTRRRAHRRR